MNFRDPQALETFLHERIREKTEVDKLDFKLDLNISEQREKLNLVRLINAMANTYDLEFDDHGFLIYGMNREDGRVTRAVSAFSDLGTDKIENQIGQLLRAYVHPAPQFNVYGFKDPDIGAWGVIVIWPDQTPPFVFSKQGTWKNNGKTEQMWRAGEWRVRHNGTVSEPGPDDYARMLTARVQAATGPLREEIRSLQAQVHRLEGTVQAMQEESAPHLSVKLIRDGQEISTVEFVPPAVGGKREVAVYLEEIEDLQARSALNQRVTSAPKHNFRDRNGHWVYHIGQWSPKQASVYQPLPADQSERALTQTVQFWTCLS